MNRIVFELVTFRTTSIEHSDDPEKEVGVEVEDTHTFLPNQGPAVERAKHLEALGTTVAVYVCEPVAVPPRMELFYSALNNKLSNPVRSGLVYGRLPLPVTK